MNIGIDARFIHKKNGFGRYTQKLLESLTKFDRANHYYVFVLPEAEQNQQLKTLPWNFSLITVKIPWYGWWEQLLWPLILYRYRLDLMHFLHFNIPILYKKKFIVTIHDLILLSFPSTRATTLAPLVYKLKYLAYRLALRHALFRSQKIITVSRFTKNEIHRFFPNLQTPVSVILEAGPSEITGEKKNNSKTFIYVGTAYPHKNISLLIGAFHQFTNVLPGYNLILVLPDDYFSKQVLLDLQRWPQLASLIQVKHNISDSELEKLYLDSLAFIFPSRYEGFGLPGLEAMAHNLPLIAASSSCLPEIYGSAALFFKDNDQEDLVEKMLLTAKDARLREKMVHQGQQRIKLFDWDIMAKETLAIYERLKS